MINRSYRFILITSICILAGNICAATIKGIPIPGIGKMQIPTQVQIKVRYIQQNNHISCATTAMTMLLSHYEGLKQQPLDADYLWTISNTSANIVKIYGNDMAGLQRIATHYGYKSEYVEQLSFNELEYLLSKGILVIINVRAKTTGATTHALLVTGYDQIKQQFFIHDSANKYLHHLQYTELMTRWSAHLAVPRGMSYRSGLIVYPKEYTNTTSNCEADYTTPFGNRQTAPA